MSYQCTKKYGHERGYSVAFRQWRAQSHCRFIHGYSLAFEFTFETLKLDHRNWVLDFGDMKEVKTWLDSTFDHKTLVAKDDPNLLDFRRMHSLRMIDMLEVANVGVEAFAELAYTFTTGWLTRSKYPSWVQLIKVQVWEHPSNSASIHRSSTIRHEATQYV